MNARTVVFVSVLLCLALLPTATGATAELRFAEGFGAASFYFDSEVEGQAAADLRMSIDSAAAGGNGDGRVTHGESIHYVFQYRQVFEDLLEAGVRSGNLTLDGKVPAGIDLDNATLVGATGPTASTARITIVLEGTLRFAGGGEGRHTLTLTAGDPDVGELHLVVHAPPGHLVESAPDAVVAEDRRSAQLSNAGGAGDLVVVFTPEAGPAGVPLAGWTPAAGCLLALLAARRVHGQQAPI